MAELIASNNMTLIVGLGVTGLSVGRYLRLCNQPFYFADDCATDQRVAQVQQDFPNVHIDRVLPNDDQWQDIRRAVLSPGVPRQHPAIQSALAHGVEVVGDVELFAEEAKAPVVAITGSNGKSTVTSLVGEMARRAGIRAAVGGNLGTPALDLLDEACQLYILELSSFQLESTFSLSAEAATVLNVSQDHLDRYSGFQEYFLTKQRVYHRAKHIVFNKDDPFTQPPLGKSAAVTRFCQSVPDLKDFGLLNDSGEVWLARGLTKLLAVDEMRMKGSHNALNALAALALGHSIGLDMDVMLQAIREFPGLPHRCQWICSHRGVEYVNDSKATNIGATQAALLGLANDKNIILIAGGDGKGADFSELSDAVKQCVKKLIVLGKDRESIIEACGAFAPSESVDSLDSAVRSAYREALPGDTVLLSPACSSLDMFRNYQDRGQQFIDSVEALCRP